MDPAIRRIESGTHVTVRPGRPDRRPSATSIRCSPAGRPSPTRNARRCTERIAAVMDDSVAKHMRADVTVGAFLSGGIDSTAIAALAKRYNPDLITFTTGFEREGYSEVDVAAESAAAIGVRHVVKTVSAQELTDDAAADRLVPGRPGRRPGAGAAVLRRQRGPQARQGGALRRGRRRAVRRLQHLPRAVQPAAAHLAARRRCARAWPRSAARCREGFRGKDMLRRGSLDLEDRYYGNARIFREEQLARAAAHLRPGASRSGTSPTRSTRRRTGWDPIARMQHVDLFTWLRGDILVKADKMTMANSLELRVPFLDTEVFEVARTIPPDQKVTKQTTKLALRRALERIVPPHVLHRRKLGFPVPIRHYLADESYDWARHIIAARRPTSTWTRRPCWRCSTRTGPARPTTPAGSGRCWCSDLARHLRRGADHPRDPGTGLPGRL